MGPTHCWADPRLVVGPGRLAPVGADVDPFNCHLHRLQVADLAANNVHECSGLEASGVPHPVARTGRRELSCRRHTLRPPELSSTRVGRCHGVPFSWPGSFIRGCPNDPHGARVLCGVDRNDRDRADPAFRCFSFALVLVAKRRRANASPDEPSAGLNQSQRVLGAALEHSVPGLDASVSFPPTHVLLRATFWRSCGIHIQRRVT